MSEIMDLSVWGDCSLCEAEDLQVWVFRDKHGKGHLLCKDCIEALVAWGLMEKPEFELEEGE